MTTVSLKLSSEIEDKELQEVCCEIQDHVKSECLTIVTRWYKDHKRLLKITSSCKSIHLERCVQ